MVAFHLRDLYYFGVQITKFGINFNFFFMPPRVAQRLVAWASGPKFTGLRDTYVSSTAWKAEAPTIVARVHVSVGTEDEGWNTVHTRTKLYWSVNLIILSCMWNLCFYLCYYIVVAACDAALDCFYYFRLFFWFLLSGDISENYSKFNRILDLVVTFFVFYFATLAVFYFIVVLCLLWSQCVIIEDKGQQRNKRQERLRNKTKGAKIKMAVFRGHCGLRIVYVWLNVPNIHFAQTTVTSYK